MMSYIKMFFENSIGIPFSFSVISKKLKTHLELIMALTSGLLILLAWIFHETPSETPSIILLLTAFIVGGYAKAKEGIIETIKEKKLNVELLMVLAAIGSASIGHWTEGAILIFIFALSGALETYTENKSSHELKALMDLQPETANLLLNNKVQKVPVANLKIGDHILIKAGERIPTDGLIVKGHTSVDESALTGESLPVTKSKEEAVFASTINLNGNITVRIHTLPSQTLFQKIIQLVQQAQAERSRSQAFIERFENSYVKVVLGMVAMMMVIPHFLLDWSWNDTIYRAMILLVVASPCALVASIMPATLSAISSSARNGVLFKGGAHLETLGEIDAIAFDKTGTLTEGKPVVTNTFFEHIDQRLIEIIYSVERYSNHPLAHAISNWCEEQTEIKAIEIEDITHLDGKGIQAKVGDVHWLIGNTRLVGDASVEQFVQKHDISSDRWLGKTVIFVKRNEEILGLFVLQDKLRQEAMDAVNELKQLGIKTIMLTGDNEQTAQEIAKEIDIHDFRANCLPEDKVDAIKQEKNSGFKIAMIGDGINDAPALATANLGVAMGAGTDVALETADMVLVKNSLPKIVDSIKLSKKMNRIIKQNILFSIAVILTLIASNFLQAINLPLGVIGHEGSTILVILNGLRLLKKNKQ